MDSHQASAGQVPDPHGASLLPETNRLKTSLPAAVEVSIGSRNERNAIPRSPSAATVSSRWRGERPSRSSFQTTRPSARVGARSRKVASPNQALDDVHRVPGPAQRRHAPRSFPSRSVVSLLGPPRSRSPGSLAPERLRPPRIGGRRRCLQPISGFATQRQTPARRAAKVRRPPTPLPGPVLSRRREVPVPSVHPEPPRPLHGDASGRRLRLVTRTPKPKGQ